MSTPEDQGLIEFYSSQATVMLAQYDNIVRLLGSTNDYTAPVTHCEILLRSFLRAYLPPQFVADKGFIYGRRQDDEKTRHCPEIDILIHDEIRAKPVFRLEDFVIVRGGAACGAIQVKRFMDAGQLEIGICNIVEAKAHRQQVLRNDYIFPPDFFSAVIFFDEEVRKDNKLSETYRNCLKKVLGGDGWLFAPDVIGSLKGHILTRNRHGQGRLGYACYSAYRQNENIALQVLLCELFRKLEGFRGVTLSHSVLASPEDQINLWE
jgi:hypothetical protein